MSSNTTKEEIEYQRGYQQRLTLLRISNGLYDIANFGTCVLKLKDDSDLEYITSVLLKMNLDFTTELNEDLIKLIITKSIKKEVKDNE
jgi:hypothetical protein